MQKKVIIILLFLILPLLLYGIDSNNKNNQIKISNSSYQNEDKNANPKSEKCPILYVEPINIYYGQVDSFAAFLDSFRITNIGDGCITGSISENISWISSLSDTTINLGKNESLKIVFSVSLSSVVGFFQGNVNIFTNAGEENVKISGFTPTIEVSFEFANHEVKEINNSYYLEYDVMISASDSGTYFGPGQVYFSYNTDAFGEYISFNNSFDAIKGELVKGELVPGTGLYLYNLIEPTDNDFNIVSVTTEYNFPSYPTSANKLPTSNTQYLHMSMEIADTSAMSNITFAEDLMRDQIYQTNQIHYVPVIALDTLNVPLNPPQDKKPAQPQNLNIEILSNDVILTWNKVDSTIDGQSITVDYYRIFDSPNPYFGYDSLANTTDTVYIHQGAADSLLYMFYKIIAIKNN